MKTAFSRTPLKTKKFEADETEKAQLTIVNEHFEVEVQRRNSKFLEVPSKLFFLLIGAVLNFPPFVGIKGGLIVYSQSCCDMPGWQYLSVITIDNTCCTTTLTNKGYLISVNTQALISAGKMKPDGSDIRFKDAFCNTATLDYCIETGINTTATLIWVKLPSLPANGTTLVYMFYGNSSATAAQNCPSIFQNTLTVTSAVTLSGVQYYDVIDVQGGGTINISSGSILELNALKITITGNITGNAAGYGPQSGPGTGINGGGGVGGSGGSYGGQGGTGCNSVGLTYGTATGTDIDMGSGGGGSDCPPSAAGGGAVKIIGTYVTINGVITVNGQTAANCYNSCNSSEAAGGGSGGGILVQCGYCNGTGNMQARGGDGGASTCKEAGGGGGGGRIKICYSQANTFSGTTNVSGGIANPDAGQCTGQAPGQNGTSNAYSCPAATITAGPEQPVVIVPAAAFAATNACVNTSVNFTNNSTIQVPATIASQLWDFGDASTSTLLNPAHTYTSTGTFTVILTVTSDSGCTDTAMRTVVVGPFPVAGFSVADVCANDTALFNNQSTLTSGTMTYQWDFDDATGSSSQNPPHIYITDNTYNVTLTVTSDMGCINAVTKPVTIYPVPQASFAVNNICIDQSAVFTNTTAINGGGSLTYAWDFGDGFNSLFTNPTHNYSATGTYTVILGALSIFNCADTAMKSVIVSPEPVADFSTSDVCLGIIAAFTNLSAISGGAIISYQWDFGDGIGTSFVPTPNYTYSSAGTFPVRLIINSDKGCEDTVTKNIEIFPLPIADFLFNDTCLGFPNNFLNTSTITGSTIVTSVWDFGDGFSSASPNASHTYSALGTYIVELLVITADGCRDSTTYTLSVNPIPVADFSTAAVCETQDALFTNLSSVINPGIITNYLWDFGDGNTDINTNPTHTYTDGIYTVTLGAVTDQGCFDTVQKSITIFPSPATDFNFQSQCNKIPISFLDATTINSGAVISWLWDFNDLSPVDTAQNPQHLFPSDGIYNVRLIAFSGLGCTDTIVKPVEVYILPVAAFSGDSVCLGNVTNFTDNTNFIDTPAFWDWNFGDNFGTSVSQNPGYTYGADSVYTVRLIVLTDEGCRDTVYNKIRVYALPVVQITSDTIRGCVILPVQFYDKSFVMDSAEGNSIIAWYWDFGDTSYSSAKDPNHDYDASGTFDIIHEATTARGCKTVSIYNDYIIADPLPTAGFTVFPQPTTILGSTIYFGDSTQLAAWWFWDFGDGDSSIVMNPSHTYNDTGTYLVKQLVLSINNCRDSVDKIIKIDPDYTLFIPNAFSPDNDAKNEVFHTKGIYPLKYDMFIFNRWGNEIYHTSDPDKGWDGHANNGSKLAQQDVYVYMIYVVDANQKKHTYVGHVTLVK